MLALRAAIYPTVGYVSEFPEGVVVERSFFRAPGQAHRKRYTGERIRGRSFHRIIKSFRPEKSTGQRDIALSASKSVERGKIPVDQLQPKRAHDGYGKTKVAEERPLHRILPAFFCDAVESAMTWAFHGSSKPNNFYMRGSYAPVEEFGPEDVLSVKGVLPQCLNGEFLRVGPNPKFEPVGRYHWFDGDGMLHGLRIKDGKVTYVSRFVRTSRLEQEEYWGSAKFSTIGSLIGVEGLFSTSLYYLRVSLGVLDNSNGVGNANTALAYHNGKLLSLNEGDKPYIIRVLEDGDLETVGRLDYNQKLNHAFTAHPKVDPVTGEMFTFGYQFQGPDHVTYRVISKDGVMKKPVPITVSGPIMMHDFAITENYAIFMDCPLYFNPMV